MAKDQVKDEAELQAEMDELAARRAAAKDGGDDPPAAGDGEPGDQSLEELERARAQVAAEQEEADGQFALEIPEAGRKLNLGTIIPRGVPVEMKYKMTGRPIPNVKGGLMDPADTTGLLLATRVVEKIVISFERDGDLKIEKATVEVRLGARSVVNAHSEAGELLLSGVAEAA
jgi:hypothetical protein